MFEILLSKDRYKIHIEFLRILACVLAMYFFIGDTVGAVIGEGLFSLAEKCSGIFS